MSQVSDAIWHAKLHARLHDPAEKPLVLMRDPGTSHEEGTARVLRETIFGSPAHPSGSLAEALKRADWWASSADRVAFPSASEDGRYPQWQQVRFDQNPVLVHPLTGQPFKIGEHEGQLRNTTVEELKAGSLHHFQALVQRSDSQVDLRRTMLALWRFGPELSGPLKDELGALWPVLPADTRTPDHTIWQHLDLTSAFAGAFVSDENGEAALLSLSIGPVQDFIALGRSTSDLWAGSHFLSRLIWEGLRVICEALGPDALLFPQLRGVPQVDLWLREQCGVDSALFAGLDWTTRPTDANPLFVAALPNRFVAIVPANRAAQLAESCTLAMREFVRRNAEQALARVLAAAAIDDPDRALPCWSQLQTQLDGFPEVHWSAVPFHLAERSIACLTAGDTTSADATDEPDLRTLLGRFYPAAEQPGYFDSAAWKALLALPRRDRGQQAAWFWDPRPAALYPALYDLAERSLAARKTLRPFVQSTQRGYRCSLSAEVEWLTTDIDQLQWSPGQRRDNGTLWTTLAEKQPSWVKRGEHLGALALLKRLWPTLFVEEVKSAGLNVDRYVVSSHSFALAGSLQKWLEQPQRAQSPEAERILAGGRPSALPPRLVAQRDAARSRAVDLARRIPDYLDAAAEDERKSRSREADVRALLGSSSLETYYGLLLMDGDRLGAWLGAQAPGVPSYEQLFHPQVAANLAQKFADQAKLTAYRQAPRAPSPAFHSTLSAALNAFALELAPRLVERACAGKLIYAGGDDLMALSTSTDLPDMMDSLRAVYSGRPPTSSRVKDRLKTAGISECDSGHALARGRLLRLMGEKASASVGAVIAHKMAPLGSVLRALRRAEQQAKREGGRDAFALTLIKRSGGSQTLIAKFRYGEGEEQIDTLAVFSDLRDFLANEASRRAAYLSMEWLRELGTEPADGPMLQHLLAYQLDRQASSDWGRKLARTLARQLVRLALAEASRPRAAGQPAPKATEVLATFLSVAEFLAREQRRGQSA